MSVCWLVPTEASPGCQEEAAKSLTGHHSRVSHGRGRRVHRDQAAGQTGLRARAVTHPGGAGGGGAAATEAEI